MNRSVAADGRLQLPRLLRREILDVGVRLSAWIGVPVVGAYTLVFWRTGKPIVWTGLEFLALLVMAASKRLARGGSLRIARRVFTVGFGLTTLFAMLQYGPNFGVGVFFITWLLSFIFFERHWILAAGLGTSIFLVVGVIASQRLIWTPWLDGGPSLVAWLRMSLSVAVLSSGLGFMLDRVLDGLEESLRAEIQARSAEAEAQADREAALTALAANQRIESLGRLAGGVAHDFNNALGVLALGLDTIEGDTDPRERAHSVEMMQRALRGARDTTRQLLAFSRQGSEPGTVADPSAVVQGMARSLVRLFPESVQVVVETAVTGRVAMGVGELEQALLNLCLNARDAMGGEGTLTLRTRLAERDPPSAVIEVTDSGSGMSEEVRRRALDPFFTTKESGSGTGLGLAMVLASARRAGGNLEIDSAPGRGATVRMTLPITDAPPTEPMLEAPSSSAPRVQRILYVEDEPTLVRMTARALGKAGHHVEIATTVAEGLERLASGPLPDLLLSDARLPDGSSAPVLREFRRRKPRGAVILCSGYVEDDTMVSGIEREALTFLQKPFGMKTLLEAVDRAIG